MSPQPAADPPAADVFTDVARKRLRARLSTTDQAMSVGAAVLLPLGLVLVFLGWYGAARTPYLFEQVPYLLSGGLLGLGLVLTGGFVLFGSWIARTGRQQRELDLELLEAMRGVRDELTRLPLLLHEAVATPQAAPPLPRTRRKTGPAVGTHNGTAEGAARGLVATARGSMLHRSDCAVVGDRKDLHAVPADGDGLRPCRLCDPLGAQRSLT